MVETFDLKSSKDHAFNKFHFQMKICVKIIDAKNVHFYGQNYLQDTPIITTKNSIPNAKALN